jgi:hypothetical protein
VSAVEVDATTVPELAVVMRWGKRSKVRLFEAVCGRGFP